MKKYKKYNKHLKWLESVRYSPATYGNKILFINKERVFDCLTPIFCIDIKEQTVFSYHMTEYLMFSKYRYHIDSYCKSKYGFMPVWKRWEYDNVINDELFFKKTK